LEVVEITRLGIHQQYLRHRKDTVGRQKVLVAALTKSNSFKWRHYQPEIILLCVRRYPRYALSYRDLEAMMSERGLPLDHTTIYRWVQAYAPKHVYPGVYQARQRNSIALLKIIE
jgi:hypothetical protein